MSAEQWADWAEAVYLTLVTDEWTILDPSWEDDGDASTAICINNLIGLGALSWVVTAFGGLGGWVRTAKGDALVAARARKRGESREAGDL